MKQLDKETLFCMLYKRKKSATLIEKNKLYVTGRFGKCIIRFGSKFKFNFEKYDKSYYTLTSSTGFKKKEKPLGSLFLFVEDKINGLLGGYVSTLKLVGRGLVCSLSNNDRVLHLKVGLSHIVNYYIPKDIAILIRKKNNYLVITGTSFQRVREVSARIRLFKKPVSYTGKGIFIRKQKIKRKVGKKAVF